MIFLYFIPLTGLTTLYFAPKQSRREKKREREREREREEREREKEEREKQDKKSEFFGRGSFEFNDP